MSTPGVGIAPEGFATTGTSTVPGSATGGAASIPGVGDAGGASVWSRLGNFLQKKGSSLDDLMKPVGKTMQMLDILGVNKPLDKPPPLKSRIVFDEPPIPQFDPNAQRLAIMQAFNLQG